MENIKNYLQDVVKEMRKVNWPSRNEMIANTGITLIATLIISLFIFGADKLISAILEIVYS